MSCTILKLLYLLLVTDGLMAGYPVDPENSIKIDNMFQGLILLLFRLLWLQPRTGLIFESSNECLEPEAAHMCLVVTLYLHCWGVEVWDPHF